LFVKQIPVGNMQNFSYVVGDEEGGTAIAIDSGWETGPIVRATEQTKVEVKFALATHNHFDHTATLKELASELGAKVVAHERSPIQHDLSVKDGDTLQFGKGKARVLHTPGHTKDSICIYDGADLFTGDTLFIGNCGRIDLPGGSAEEMYKSLHEVILKLPAETVIYPGHDYGEVPFRKLGEEARLNPTLSAKNYLDFMEIP
jgi:hydroxyacylglutathione hydrolase